MRLGFLILSILLLELGLFSREVAPRIVSTTTILHDMVLHIKPSDVFAECVLPIGADPHNHEATPSDMNQLNNATIIIKNGLHLEGWLDKLIAQIQGVPVVNASDGISPLYDVNGITPDPHIWMDPLLGIQMVNNISKALQAYLPEYQNEILQNTTSYINEIQSLHNEITVLVNSISKEKRILITTHDAFQYYGKQYDFTLASLQGISTDAEVRTVDYNTIVKQIRSLSVAAIFVETTINPSLFYRIANDEGIAIGGELFADSVGDEESEGDSYIKMLKSNTETIINGLQLSSASEFESRFSVLFFLLILLAIIIIILFAIRYLQFRYQPGGLGTQFQLIIKNLTVSYGAKPALSFVNLNITNGKMVGVLGPNGSGKSTMLKAALKLIPSDSGIAQINGVELNKRFQQIAYIPQREEIDMSFPATAIDIVLSGKFPHYAIGKLIPKYEYENALEALKQVGLAEYANSSLSNLSGGQQQRVFLARALCQNAKVLILDEPFVGVDASTEETIIEILQSLCKKGAMVIIVHHDLSDIEDYFDEVVLLNKRLIASGLVQDVFTPENIRATFHSKNLLLEDSQL